MSTFQSTAGLELITDLAFVVPVFIDRMRPLHIQSNVIFSHMDIAGFQILGRPFSKPFVGIIVRLFAFPDPGFYASPWFSLIDTQSTLGIDAVIGFVLFAEDQLIISMAPVFDGIRVIGVFQFVENVITVCLHQFFNGIHTDLIHILAAIQVRRLAFSAGGISRIHGTGHQYCHTGQQRSNCCPDLGLLPLGHIDHTLLCITLTKGQGRQGKTSVSSCQPKQGLGIICPDSGSVHPEYRFITAHFHILAGQDECQPNQWIEPMQAQRKIGKQAEQMILAPDVAPFMGHDISLFLRSQVRG